MEPQVGSKWQVATRDPAIQAWVWNRATVLRVELGHVLVEFPDRLGPYGPERLWVARGLFADRPPAWKGWGF